MTLVLGPYPSAEHLADGAAEYSAVGTRQVAAASTLTR